MKAQLGFFVKKVFWGCLKKIGLNVEKLILAIYEVTLKNHCGLIFRDIFKILFAAESFGPSLKACCEMITDNYLMR